MSRLAVHTCGIAVTAVMRLGMRWEGARAARTRPLSIIPFSRYMGNLGECDGRLAQIIFIEVQRTFLGSTARTGIRAANNGWVCSAIRCRGWAETKSAGVPGPTDFEISAALICML